MAFQRIKNAVGDMLGYARCPVTNETYWHTDIASVLYSESSGVLVSARALSEVPKERIAQIVFERSKAPSVNPFGQRYSLEQITEKIPTECMISPWKVKKNKSK